MKLHRFHGGIHPPQHKNLSSEQPIRALPLPKRLVVPLHQHIGSHARACVAVGERVLKGQRIAAADGHLSVAIHAPTSGVVRAIEMLPVPHASGLPDTCVVIEADGEDRWIARAPTDYRALDARGLLALLRDAGVAGLGGAAFPSHIKLARKPAQEIKTLVINGAECEPYITCDDRLMRERADEILRGVEIIRYILGAEIVLIGIEDNKPAAISAMREAAKQTAFTVCAVPTIYPSGGAKQLVKILTGIEVAADNRSLDLGVQCFNVATAYAVQRAIAHGEPLISRIVTVTGNVERPGNVEALIGTPLQDLVAFAGKKEAGNGYLMGGPMMGFDLPSLKAPLVKATNCIIAKSPARFPDAPPSMPCIRCGKCAEVCPAELQPMDLYWFARANNLGKAQEYSLFDCIECGACDYACPSHIPLVAYYRHAKSEIRSHEKDKAAADLARQRHEFRLQRIEREKEDRAKRLAEKTGVAKTDSAALDPDRAIIMAALAKAQAEKARIVPKNTDNLPPEKLAEIAAIEARRKKIREMAHNPPGDEN